MLFDSIKLTGLLMHLKLTPSQFYVLYCVWRKQFELILKYLYQNPNVFNKHDLDYIIGLGYLEDYDGDVLTDEEGDLKYSIDFYQLVITPSFNKLLFVEDDVLGNELFDAFPSFILINGTKVVSKSCDKDEYVKKYAIKIGHNKDKHEEVLEVLEWAKGAKVINFSIKNFIDGELWKALSDMRGDNTRTTNNTFR